MRKMARMAMVASAMENQQRMHHEQPDPANTTPHNPYSGENRQMRYTRPPMGNYNRRMTDDRYYRDEGYPRQRQEEPDRRMEYRESNDARMGGEGYFIWDNAEGMDDRQNGTQEARGGGSEMRMSYDQGPSNVTDMRSYSHLNHGSPDEEPMHHRQMTQNRIGFQHHGETLTREDAQEWVRSMRAADGSRGGRWKSMADVKPLAERMGITGEKEMVEFFAIINAMYSDYCKVAKKHGVDKPEFYADLAKAWIHDEDAEENKAMLYYDCIVKKQ